MNHSGMPSSCESPNRPTSTIAMCVVLVWNTSGMSTASSPAPANASDATATAFQNRLWPRRNQSAISVGTSETTRNAASEDII